MTYVDTHAHLHDPEFFEIEDAEAALVSAVKSGVTKIICVATSLEDSKRAIAFAHKHPNNCWATIGIHPHEAAKLSADELQAQIAELAELVNDDKVVAVGECGFDFYYNDRKTSLVAQEALLNAQIQIAISNQLPLSFHVREAFDDFWRVFTRYSGVRGVLHSFTDTQKQVELAKKHGLLVGVNGIATFTSHLWQKEIFKELPLEKIVVETDSPFLTPHPKRGTINTPENVIYITRFLAELRDEDELTIAKATTANAESLFKI